MDANGTIQFVLGLPKTICFVKVKGPYFRQRCALRTLNCMELSGTPSKLQHILFKSVSVCKQKCHGLLKRVLVAPPALEQAFGNDARLFQSQWSKIHCNKGCYMASTWKGQRA